MTYTHTRTYVVYSRHLFRFMAKLRAKRLNGKFVAQEIRRYRGDRYEVRVEHGVLKRFRIIDWGET